MATFGNTGAPSLYYGSTDIIRGVVDTGAAGTATSITAAIDVKSTSDKFKCALYVNSTGALVAETEEKTGISPGAKNVTFDFASPPVISAISYDIAIWCYKGGSSDPRIATTGSYPGRYKALAYGSWPDP